MVDKIKPNIAMCESFSNKEETALFTSDKGAARAYRLEISNVNQQPLKNEKI